MLVLVYVAVSSWKIANLHKDITSIMLGDKNVNFPFLPVAAKKVVMKQ
jgi:hypothetical protein